MKYTKREQEIIDEAAEIIERVKRHEASAVRLHRTQLSRVMVRAGSGHVSFVKKNGALRLMYYEANAERPTLAELRSKHIVVWDIERVGYRKVNLETVTRLKTGEADYRII